MKPTEEGPPTGLTVSQDALQHPAGAEHEATTRPRARRVPDQRARTAPLATWYQSHRSGARCRVAADRYLQRDDHAAAAALPRAGAWHAAHPGQPGRGGGGGSYEHPQGHLGNGRRPHQQPSLAGHRWLQRLKSGQAFAGLDHHLAARARPCPARPRRQVGAWQPTRCDDRRLRPAGSARQGVRFPSQR